MTTEQPARRGRKQQPPGSRRRNLTVWLLPHLRQWLLQQPQGAGPMIEELVAEAYAKAQKFKVESSED